MSRREETKAVNKTQRRQDDKKLACVEEKEMPYKKSKRGRNRRASLEHNIQTLKNSISSTQQEWYRRSCKERLKLYEKELEELNGKAK